MSSNGKASVKTTRLAILIGYTFFLILFLSHAVFAGEGPGNEPLPIHKQKPVRQHLTINSVNYSAADFYHLMTSGDERERRNAMFYLLGVMDATEGRTWCGYDQSFDIDVMRQKVEEYGQRIPETSLAAMRASDVIEAALKKGYPACKVDHNVALPSSRGDIRADSINISVEDYYNAAYASQKRIKAEAEHLRLYALGVFDATEGKLWCNYRTFKSVTLRENLYEYFLKHAQGAMHNRAAFFIMDALRQELPACEVKQ